MRSRRTEKGVLMGLLGGLFGSLSSFGGGNITWYCDGCNATLNEQSGFSSHLQTWTCTECGYINDLSDGNVYESEEAYQEAMGIPRCPMCGSMVVGDAPDALHYFNCKTCGNRYFLIDGELMPPSYRGDESSRKCANCGLSLRGALYTSAWENGNNSDGYVKCPHCGYVEFDYDD